MLKKAVQQGRSERQGTATFPVGGCPRRLAGQAPAYAGACPWASEWSENATGGLFQHPVRASSDAGEGRGI